MKPEDSGLWPFALALYGAAGVSQACLTLQDRAGADVPMLLWAAWLGADGRALGPNDPARARDAVAAWHREIVQPLRAVRQRMKSGPAPAPSDRTEALRDRLKAVEIGAERIELAMLETILPAATPTPAAAAIIRRNLGAVLGEAPPDAAPGLAADLAAALDLIAAAAAGLAPGAGDAAPA